jgi:hypothetical protein
VGVDLYQFFLDLEASDPDTVVPVTFWQDGSAPEPSWRSTRVGAIHTNRATARPGFSARAGSDEADAMPPARADHAFSGTAPAAARSDHAEPYE